MLTNEELSVRYRALEEEVADALDEAGDSDRAITIIAVSKTFPLDYIKRFLSLGFPPVLGESKAQELRDKANALPYDVAWHFIGRIQTNKVKHIVPFATLIHSVSNEKTLDAIDARAQKEGKVSDVLLQVNISREKQKDGVAPDMLHALLDYALEKAHVRVRGCMGVASYTDNSAVRRREFALLRTLRDRAQTAYPEVTLDALSMGMSGDFRDALLEGSTIIRVGSLLFGARDYS